MHWCRRAYDDPFDVPPVIEALASADARVYESDVRPHCIRYTARRGPKERRLYAELSALLGPGVNEEEWGYLRAR